MLETSNRSPGLEACIPTGYVETLLHGLADGAGLLRPRRRRLTV
jgi:hypothetical protein